MQGANCCDGMLDSWRMAAALEEHALPERRVEVSCQLRRAVPDEELEGMLHFSVFAPRDRYGGQMQPQRGVDNCICVSTDSAHIGWLWCRAFSRSVQKPHTVVAELYAGVVVTLAGALYAVIAGNLDSIFANAASASGVL